MTRQVDVRALLSHVVRGDGINRCRICMGDTTEGQVHLADTVLMDGEKPVTLSELLETVTGIQVEVETELPAGACRTCTHSALAAWQFIHLTQESYKHWSRVDLLLTKLKVQATTRVKTLFIGCDTLIGDNVPCIHPGEAIDRINTLIGLNRKTHSKYQRNRKSDLNACRDCGKVFSSPNILNRHLLNTNKRACYMCGRIFSKDRLARHLNRNHGKLVVNCHTCHKLFETQSQLDYHMKLLHGDESFQCIICKNGFKNDRSLRAHMFTHTLFSCSSCNASFENRKCYMYHRLNCDGTKHAAKGVFECNDCGNIYTKKPSLKIHIVQKHLNVLPYVCQICGKRSSTKSHHKSHELVHKTVRKVYECFCGAKMTTELGFNMHQRIHSGEKPYQCAACGNRFLSASRRLDHIKRKHRSKDLPHACSDCDAKFLRPFELKKHYRSAHM